MYCKSKIAIKPPEVAKMWSIQVDSPLRPWNLTDPLILKELDKKNKKKNGKYIGRTYSVSMLNTFADINMKR